MFITVYPYHWGIGVTPEASRKLAQKQGGKGDVWVTKQLPPDVSAVHVTDWGEICWTWPEGIKRPGYTSLLVVAKGRKVS